MKNIKDYDIEALKEEMKLKLYQFQYIPKHSMIKMESLNEEQLKVLQKLGCQLGQGYYFARPLPEDEFWERYVKK